MKLCVLGASGKSGRAIVRMALKRGHAVTSVARNTAGGRTSPVIS